MVADSPITAIENPPGEKRISRRRFFTQLLAAASVPVVAGYYTFNIEPFWPRYHEVPIQITGLPKSFEGFRVLQITDMHTGHAPTEYLQQALTRALDLKPDIVLFTGDLIHHNPVWIDAVTTLVKTFSVPVFASFGNHDYAPFRGDDEPFDPNLAEKMHDALTAVGCTVLRNDSKAIEHPDGRLWLVGLDDLWFGDFKPKVAFKNVAPNEPVIALSHNPDTAEMLAPHHPDLILSGHTHGGQIRLPFYGALRLNVAQPQYDRGHFQLPNSQLYVSSGVGYIVKARFNCRPEVPVFVLQS
jgi:predicted MPP superfamily phosphohydrolase